VPDSVRFELLDNNIPVAVLVTNNRVCSGRTRDNTCIKMQRRWTLKPRPRIFIYKEDTLLFATIEIRRPLLLSWFRTDKYKITFEETRLAYDMMRRNRSERKHKNAISQFDFTINGETKCSISNFKKEKRWISFGNYPAQGIVAHTDGIDAAQLLCFLQLMYIRIELDSAM
jgi:hypothetical protein